MSIRVVNGNTFTEDGWPLVDQAGCTWITIPGTSVSIQVQTGLPATVLGAWEADWNAYVEPLEDPTTGCWTEGNSVLGGFGKNNGSNHLGGTAVDSDWEKHPMGPHAPDDPRAGFTVAQVNTLQEMKDFYTFTAKDGTVIQIVWWANDWDSPHDSMHSQMGYDTYKYHDEVAEWCRTHIRPDGFSTFRRGDAMDFVTLVANAMGNVVGVDYAALTPHVQDCLRKSNCTNNNRIAMWFAQIGHESVGLKYMKEIGDASYFAQYNNRSDLGNGPTDGPRYPGRGPIQVTGRNNYRHLSQWAYDQGYVPTATYFEDSPEQLEDLNYAFLGAIWYWTVARPDINELCDQGDVNAVTRRINGGTNGLSDRVDRWNRCRIMDLTPLIQQGDDWMTNPDALQMITEIHRETVTQKSPSRSFMAEAGDLIDTPLGIAWNTDGNAWTLVLTEAYRLGVPKAVEVVEHIAENGVYPGTYASEEFNAWLATFGQAYCKGLVAEKNRKLP